MKRGETGIECQELKIIDEQVFNATQEIRESRAELSPGFGRRGRRSITEGELSIFIIQILETSSKVFKNINTWGQDYGR
jgi:hypothetical protein